MSYSLYRRIRGTIDGPRSLEGSPEDARVPLLAHRGDRANTVHNIGDRQRRGRRSPKGRRRQRLTVGPDDEPVDIAEIF